jgi:hypothetical protein
MTFFGCFLQMADSLLAAIARPVVLRDMTLTLAAVQVQPLIVALRSLKSINPLRRSS